MKKCYEYKKPFALLLPITAFEGKTRGKMFRENGIQALIFDGRINFMKDMIKDYNKKSGSWFNTSWFCYKLLPKDLIFEQLKK